MSELIKMPNNIYEVLLLHLAQLFCGESSSIYNYVPPSGGFYAYEDDKVDLKSQLCQLSYDVYALNQYVIHYFDSVYDRINEAPMGLYVDSEYGVPAHKVFECLVAAEIHGRVVGGRNDGGVDVIGPDEHTIIQCKSGHSHASNARQIYDKLIESCINQNKNQAILAVTDENFPDIGNYTDLRNRAEHQGLNIELRVWNHYSVTHPSSNICTVGFETILQEWKDNLEILSIFLTQIQRCIGQKRHISWDDILQQCIGGIRNLPNRFEDIESTLYANLSCLENAYEDDDSMCPGEKTFIEGTNGHYSDNDTNSEETDSHIDDDSEEADSDTDDDSEETDSDTDDDSEEADSDTDDN